MDLALNTTTGDLDLVNGDLYFVIEDDAVAQHVKQRLRLFQTEWFLDERAYVPYFDEIFVKSPNPVAIGAILKQIIIESPGVRGLEEFSLSIDTELRELTVDFKVRSDTGEIDFSETIGA